jgi:hypothetical protein
MMNRKLFGNTVVVYFLGELRKTTKSWVRTIIVPAGIRNEHLQNTDHDVMERDARNTMSQKSLCYYTRNDKTASFLLYTRWSLQTITGIYYLDMLQQFLIPVTRSWPRMTHSRPTRRCTPSLPWRSARVPQHPFPWSVDWYSGADSMAASFPGSYNFEFFS